MPHDRCSQQVGHGRCVTIGGHVGCARQVRTAVHRDRCAATAISTAVLRCGSCHDFPRAGRLCSKTAASTRGRHPARRSPHGGCTKTRGTDLLAVGPMNCEPAFWLQSTNPSSRTITNSATRSGGRRAGSRRSSRRGSDAIATESSFATSGWRLGELNETKNYLRDGAQCGHIGVDAFRELWRLCFAFIAPAPA